MNSVKIISDKTLRRSPPIARFSYEFLQINPVTKEEKWIKGGLTGATYLQTVLSSYVKNFINFNFNGIRNATLTIPYGFKDQVEKRVREMSEKDEKS